jgi:importin subunit alpha-2
MRRRRTEVSVELRKARKDDQLLKKRNISTEGGSIMPLQGNQSPTSMTVEEIIEGIVSNTIFINWRVQRAHETYRYLMSVIRMGSCSGKCCVMGVLMI